MYYYLDNYGYQDGCWKQEAKITMIRVQVQVLHVNIRFREREDCEGDDIFFYFLSRNLHY